MYNTNYLLIQFQANTKKHPKDLFMDFKKIKIDIKRDILLIEIKASSKWLQDSNLTPISMSGDCDTSMVDQITCCCSKKCSIRYKMDIISVNPEYLSTSGLFMEEESGCICMDSMMEISDNHCIFIYSHQQRSDTITNINPLMIMEICSKNTGLLCHGIMNQYHQSIKEEIGNSRSMLSILNPNEIENMLSINFVSQNPWSFQNIDTTEIKLYPIPVINPSAMFLN